MKNAKYPITSKIIDTATHGRMMELNILGEQKVCSFDCGYCSLGESLIRISRLKTEATFTPLDNIIREVGRALGHEAQIGKTIDTILVSGNGEPTLHPQFSQFTKDLIKIRKELMSSINGSGDKTKFILLTNGDQLDDRDVLHALSSFDEVIVKLDAGTQKAFKEINRPLSRSSLDKIILGSRALKNLSIQATITGGDLALTQPTQLEEWIEVVAMLNPKTVYLQLAKSPCADPKLKLASEDDLHRISHWLERRLKIKAQVDFDFAA